MSKQDFAQVKVSTQSESGSASGSILSAIGILVIAGLCFSGGYWLGAGDVAQTGNKTDTDAIEAKLAAQVAENRLLQATNETLQDMVLQWKKKSEQGAHTKVGELTFYKELPKQSVTPAPVPDAPKIKTSVAPQIVAKVASLEGQHSPAHSVAPVKAVDALAEHGSNTALQQPAPASNEHYRIQLASFRTESGAMEMQGKLAKAGFISQIKMADLGEKGQWYRLYAGPFDSRSAAESTQQQIEQQVKLKGFIIRGR